MNKEDFEKLVRPYIIKSSEDGSVINMELILRDFKPYSPTQNYDMVTVLTLNKLLYIPDVWDEDKGYLVFSTESEMYIYYPQGNWGLDDDEKWHVAYSADGWSENHNWVMRTASITDMNNGKGWNMGTKVNVFYYELESKLIKYLNWTIVKNPLNLK
tara:strand:+ start:546 stop:1016 length:471 start_codon:yes stop_codon:yes gene_type:complete